MTDQTIRLACAGCDTQQVERTAVVLVNEGGGGRLLLMWPCTGCGAGWSEVSAPDERALILASGAAIRRPDVDDPGWPPPTLLGHPPAWPQVRPRPTPLTRLAWLLNPRMKPPRPS